MNVSLRKRLLSMLLAAIMVLGLVPVLSTPQAQAADAATLKSELQNLRYPLAAIYSSTVKDSNLDGVWLIASTTVSTDYYKYCTLDPTRPESGNAAFPDDHQMGGTAHKADRGTDYVGYAVQTANFGDTNYLRGQSRGSYTRITGTPSDCTFQTMDGKYWNFESIPNITSWAALRLRDGKNGNSFTISASGERSYSVLKKGTSNQYLNSNSYTFRVYLGTDNSNTQRQFYFCKVSEGLYNMCEVLREAANYITDGRSDQTYADFLSVAEETLNLYTEYCDESPIYFMHYMDDDFEVQSQKLREAIAKIAVSDPYAVVLDYGRTSQVDLSEVSADFDSDVSGVSTRVTYVGATLEGTHGAVTTTMPTDLLLSGKGCSAQTEDSTFAMATDSILRFTPKKIMNGAQTLYAVYRVSPVGSPTYTLYYVTKAIKFVPATTVYYETDLGKGIYTVDSSDSLFIPFSATDTTEWGSTNTIENYSKDTTNGVLTGTINGTDPHIQMTEATCNFNYQVKTGDVVKVRIKSPTGSGSNMQVFFMTETNKVPTTGIQTKDTSYTPNGDWQIITLPIEAAVYGKTVKGIRIDPISNYNATGVFEIDWIYVGTEDEFNAPLVVDFGVGDETEWETPTTGNNVATSVKENGVLTGTVTGYDPWVLMSTASSKLKYIIQENDVVKVRFKSDACIGRDLQVFFMTDTNAYPTTGVSTENSEYYPDGQWQVVTLKILDGLVGKQITGLRIDPSGDNAENNFFESEGTYACDWIYIGPDVELEQGDAFTFTTTSEENPWEFVGTPNTVETKTNDSDPYGYDAAYAGDVEMSGNSITHVVGVGVPKMNEDKTINYEDSTDYTEASFTFTGTGFDIISRTGENQGALRVIVTDTDGNYVTTTSVINKGTTDRYQVPVVSVENLTHGTYVVHIFVNSPYKNPELPVLDREAEFWFDAVRIYNTIDTSAGTEDAEVAYKAYCNSSEADATFIEIRNKLIDPNSFDPQNDMLGVFYMDYDGDSGKTTLQNYTEVGPNNEVYLPLGTAIEFKLVVYGDIPARIDVGARSVDGAAAGLRYAVEPDSDVTIGLQTVNIQSCTTMYYPLPASEWAEDTDEEGKTYHYVYVGLYNDKDSSGILSVTDIKFGYSAPEGDNERSISFRIDREMIDGLDHEAVIDAAVAPTCTETGLTEGTHCAICGITLVAQEVVDALGHTEAIDEAVAPSCSATGLTEGTHCEVCGEVLVAQESVDMLAHTEVIDEAVAPTCTETGLTEGKHCEVCGEVLVAQQEIALLPHEYEAAVTDPTCTENGYTTYTCSVCGDSYTADETAANGHSYESAIGKAPTCTEVGERVYTCSCGHSYTEAIDALGHETVYNPKKPATCTEDGCKAHYRCTVCGTNFFDADGAYPVQDGYFTIAALGHSEVIDEAIAPTCTESGLTEGKHCAVCGEVLVARGILDALGHSYNYTDNGENHTVGCEAYDYSVTEEHTYTDGVCICGAVEKTEPRYEYNSNLGMTMNISVGAEMQVMYTVLNARVKNFESFYVEVVKDVVGGESVKTVFSLGNGNMDEISAPNGNLVGYSATYTGIFAMEMGDNFTATLYAVAEDGTIYYGDSESSSIKTYLMEKLSDESALAELKTLAVDMLNYGAAAQVNFDYDAENLVNADLTDEQKLLGTQETPSATDSSVTSGDGGRITTSVSLQSKVLLYVNCNYAKTENSNLEFVVKNLNGDVLERFAPTVAAAKMCQGVYGNVGARQMRDLITIELYDNGVLVSQTLTWNIESYVAQTREASTSSDALIATVNAMLAYGDSAAIYLTASGQ